MSLLSRKSPGLIFTYEKQRGRALWESKRQHDRSNRTSLMANKNHSNYILPWTHLGHPTNGWRCVFLNIPFLRQQNVWHRWSEVRRLLWGTCGLSRLECCLKRSPSIIWVDSASNCMGSFKAIGREWAVCQIATEYIKAGILVPQFLSGSLPSPLSSFSAFAEWMWVLWGAHTVSLHHPSQTSPTSSCGPACLQSQNETLSPSPDPPRSTFSAF